MYYALQICFKKDTCQFLKHGKRNYGKLLSKQAETQPWDILCIDLIGKYRMAPNKVGRTYAMQQLMLINVISLSRLIIYLS